MAWSTAPLLGAQVTVASGSLTLTEPVGAAAGDLLVVTISFRSNAPFTLPAGWTLVATQQYLTGNTTASSGGAVASGLMAYIVRGGSAPSYVFTRTAGDVAFGKVVAYRPTTGTTPAYDTGSANTLLAVNTTANTASITTANANSLLVAMTASPRVPTVSTFDATTDPTTASGATDTTNAPTAGTWRERYDSTTTAGADCALAVADAVRATAGATGLLTASVSESSTHVMIVGAFYEAAAVTNYNLTAAAGSYTLSGQAATLRRTRYLAGAAGSFALSGQAAVLTYASAAAYSLTAAAGSFSLGGQPAVLKRGLKVTSAVGSFSLSGQPATLKVGHKVTASVGTFALSGQPVALKVAHRLVGLSGAYTLGGQAATLSTTGSYRLTALAGAFTVSGQQAVLKVGHRLPADAAAFTLSGQPAGLTYWVPTQYVLTADPGSYLLTGSSVTLRRVGARRLNTFALLTGA